ncbi:hypothetical protein TNCT_279081, partial [Trichonephila clavata]
VVDNNATRCGKIGKKTELYGKLINELTEYELCPERIGRYILPGVSPATRLGSPCHMSPNNLVTLETLEFKDSPRDVLAAVAAGMQVVMIPDPPVDTKFCKSAILVFNTLENFNQNFFWFSSFRK